MKYNNIYIISLIFIILFSFSNCFSFVVKDNYEKYCFNKYLTESNQISFSFVVTSYPKVLINVDLAYKKNKYDSKKIIYNAINKNNDNYQSGYLKEEGYYEVCFYSQKGKEYHVSMEFDSYYEGHNIKQIVTDKEIKSINNDIKEVTDSLHNIEINARHINNRNYGQFVTLNRMIKSIKNLTYLKIFVVALMSIFQIYIITKFFGNEKRIHNIKGTFDEKSGVL